MLTTQVSSKLLQILLVSLPRVSSQLQATNILTKVASHSGCKYLVSKLMLIDMPHQFDGGVNKELIFLPNYIY